MSSPRLNLVVAACNNNGIGKNGSLPWSLRKDMDFFKKITTQTKDPDKKNAVIMGRKTWFSIPEKFRPLKGRVNVVLSRELKEVPEGVYISRSLPEAVDLLAKQPLSNQIENIHVIGGSSVYQEAMASCNCRIYLTRILADFDCDTYLPEINENVFTKIENPPNVPTELQEEKDVKFRFEVYDKILRCEFVTSQPSKGESGNCESKSVPPDKMVPSNSPVTQDKMLSVTVIGMETMETSDITATKEKLVISSKMETREMVLPHEPVKFCVMRDYEYYTTMTSSLRSKKHNGKILHIRGRHTWDCCKEKERSLPNVYHVVVSQSLSDVSHPRLLKIVSSFDEAVSLCNTKPLYDEIDSVWVMGGATIYKPALEHPLCDKLYLTHVYRDCPADTFFPQFEHNFQEVRKDGTGESVFEDNGVRYEFKIYQKI